ncbi:AAA domain-containing protein [Baffinella frigidus]|nr:AAA domain-containing protein [Cryptophyta sp. CCMP2293]
MGIFLRMSGKVTTLDHLAKDRVKQAHAATGEAAEQLKARYRDAMQRRDRLESEAKGLGAELPPAMEVAVLDARREVDRLKHKVDIAILIVDIVTLIVKLRQAAGAGGHGHGGGGGGGGHGRDDVREEVRAMLLDDAEVVLTTLCSAGLECFAKMKTGFDTLIVDEACQVLSMKMKTGFDTLIVDEACQAVEAAALIPLRLSPRRCILVGDPKQLPATVISQAASAQKIYQRSLFERLQAAGHAVVMLDTQYRMHPSIRQFPSEYFYSGALKDAEGLDRRTAPYQADPWVGTVRFFDLVRSREQRTAGNSLRNPEEAALVVNLLGYLFALFSKNGELNGQVAVLTPYKQQKSELAVRVKIRGVRKQ